MSLSIVRRQVEHVELSGNDVRSSTSILRYLTGAEMVRADCREQVRQVQLPDDAVLVWRLLGWRS